MVSNAIVENCPARGGAINYDSIINCSVGNKVQGCESEITCRGDSIETMASFHSHDRMMGRQILYL